MLVAVLHPGIVWDLKYATTDNFTGVAHYRLAKGYLEKEVAESLYAVAEDVQQRGMKLKVWDAYRPLHVQWALWKHTPDERFVAHPEKGGKHTRGTAVDLTLIDTEGKELLMPTPFDDFTEKAYRSCQDLPQKAKRNRQLLNDLMKDFVGLPNEWWHFDYYKWQNFEPKDIPFEELE